jgi:hypothetical protein
LDVAACPRSAPRPGHNVSPGRRSPPSTYRSSSRPTTSAWFPSSKADLG